MGEGVGSGCERGPREGRENLAPKPQDFAKRPLTFHSSMNSQRDSSSIK